MDSEILDTLDAVLNFARANSGELQRTMGVGIDRVNRALGALAAMQQPDAAGKENNER